jgi:putative tricarboxylic transport membrane protein
MNYKVIATLVALAGLALSAAPASAEFKPTRPIEIIVHTGPGGGADVLARFISSTVDKEKLAPVRMQVNNKPGGGGLTAMNYLVEKKGDPHAIAIFTGNWMNNPLTQSEAKVTIKDMTPIVRLVLEPAVVVVKADSPYKSLKDFIDAAKKTPGQLKQSGGSMTSRDNVVRQLVMKQTGSNWAYISFPGGGERIAALLGGHVNMMVIEPQEAGEHIRAGSMRVLAQVAEKRLTGFPNVPTLREAGVDIPNVPQVRGVVAPPGMPADAIAYYEDLFSRLSKTAAWKKYLEENQFEDGFQKSAELAQFFDQYTNRMRDILKEAGAKVVR